MEHKNIKIHLKNIDVSLRQELEFESESICPDELIYCIFFLKIEKSEFRESKPTNKIHKNSDHNETNNSIAWTTGPKSSYLKILSAPIKLVYVSIDGF